MNKNEAVKRVPELFLEDLIVDSGISKWIYYSSMKNCRDLAYSLDSFFWREGERWRYLGPSFL